MDDEIPVSVVDMDVPVTTIDEVPDDDRFSLNVHEAICHTQSMKKMHVTDSLNKLSVDICNKNNNAHVSDKASISQTQADQSQYTKKVIKSQGIKTEAEQEKFSIPNGYVPQRSQSPVVCAVAQNAQKVPESRLKPPPFVRSHSMENPELDRALSPKPPTGAQIKITQSPVSRFGLKTFTVIPPKPVVVQTHKPAGSLGTGAIKIDELGNMVKQRKPKPASAQDKHGHPAETTNDPDSPLLGKAKAFWCSNEKQDPDPAANKDASVKTREAEVPKPVPVTLISHPLEKPSVMEPLKEASGSTNLFASAVMNKLPVSNPAENTSFSENRKNLTFLKPSRRTSSQYVASAIAKYTGNPSAKVNGFQEMPDSASCGQRPLASGSSKHEIRSYQKDPQASTNTSTNPVPYFAAPKHSQSNVSHFEEKQVSSEEPQFSGSSRGSQPFGTTKSKSLDSSPVNSKQQTQASTYSTQSSFKEHTLMKNTPENTAVKFHTNRPPVPKKPDIHGPGVLPEPNQVTLFGPVKKFKPVMLKTVEKETSLHSSLMEAIQSGEGIDRLKKVFKA